MDEQYDNFSNINFNEIKPEKTDSPFSINQLKLKHFHFNSGDIDAGHPIYTSVELISSYNLEIGRLEWTKNIEHAYHSFSNVHERTIEGFSEKIDDADNLIKELNLIELRNLKNNYFSEKNPERFTHWEIEYNYYFKISGTYDNEIDEFRRISELLHFKETIKNEIEKVNNKRSQ